MSWQAVRRSAFLQMVALWPAAVTYKTVPAPHGAISTSTPIELEMMRNSMMPKKPITISILREDYLTFVTAGLKPREIVVNDGSNLLVDTIGDDPADATVDLRCVLNV